MLLQLITIYYRLLHGITCYHRSLYFIVLLQVIAGYCRALDVIAGCWMLLQVIAGYYMLLHHRLVKFCIIVYNIESACECYGSTFQFFVSAGTCEGSKVFFNQCFSTVSRWTLRTSHKEPYISTTNPHLSKYPKYLNAKKHS